MRVSGVRYRVRLRLTIRRLMAALVCFGLTFGVIHDAIYVDGEAGEIPWATMACVVVSSLLAFAVIAVKIVRFKNVFSEYRLRCHRDRQSRRAESVVASSGEASS